MEIQTCPLGKAPRSRIGSNTKSRAIPGSHDGILLVLKTRPFVHISKPRDHTADITKHVFLITCRASSAIMTEELGGQTHCAQCRKGQLLLAHLKQ